MSSIFPRQDGVRVRPSSSRQAPCLQALSPSGSRSRLIHGDGRRCPRPASRPRPGPRSSASVMVSIAIPSAQTQQLVKQLKYFVSKLSLQPLRGKGRRIQFMACLSLLHLLKQGGGADGVADLGCGIRLGFRLAKPSSASPAPPQRCPLRSRQCRAGACGIPSVLLRSIRRPGPRGLPCR